MNYQSTERQHQLAARYVLGSMRGQARAKFQRLLMEYPKLRDEVTFWEQHLNELAAQLPDKSAPKSAWEAIERRLGWRRQQVTSNRGWRWLTATLAAILVVVTLSQTLLAPMPGVPQAERIAVIQNSDARTLWLLEQREQVLDVAAVGAIDPLANEDYELWMLPEGGAAPISLGLLPQQGTRTLNVPANVDLQNIAALAVSREPLGGSPLAVPSGPVLFTTDFVVVSKT
ncbi:anti-sigma factor [Pseudidiomarina terrestris]|uniref:anti-sigma factor n=1 Tax=Pseudidiomarina terrestris TaxID=2820060 RepID=UPI0026529DD5|nr:MULTISPECIES: anti-sigma factor [unclassified Pseudidiomarina]MDN7126893.1 anti-sigma factor [Pseudidiomarina sp. 1APR75-33.1]MDN7134588.1 anti-sigma factor [Pseudidiomarina sp. 1ASP75-5]